VSNDGVTKVFGHRSLARYFKQSIPADRPAPPSGAARLFLTGPVSSTAVSTGRWLPLWKPAVKLEKTKRDLFHVNKKVELILFIFNF
jgi:hypothetical protein